MDDHDMDVIFDCRSELIDELKREYLNNDYDSLLFKEKHYFDSDDDPNDIILNDVNLQSVNHQLNHSFHGNINKSEISIKMNINTDDEMLNDDHHCDMSKSNVPIRNSMRLKNRNDNKMKMMIPFECDNCCGKCKAMSNILEMNKYWNNELMTLKQNTAQSLSKFNIEIKLMQQNCLKAINAMKMIVTEKERKLKIRDVENDDLIERNSFLTNKLRHLNEKFEYVCKDNIVLRDKLGMEMRVLLDRDEISKAKERFNVSVINCQSNSNEFHANRVIKKEIIEENSTNEVIASETTEKFNSNATKTIHYESISNKSIEDYVKRYKFNYSLPGKKIRILDDVNGECTNTVQQNTVQQNTVQQNTVQCNSIINERKLSPSVPYNNTLPPFNTIPSQFKTNFSGFNKSIVKISLNENTPETSPQQSYSSLKDMNSIIKHIENNHMTPKNGYNLPLNGKRIASSIDDNKCLPKNNDEKLMNSHKRSLRKLETSKEENGNKSGKRNTNAYQKRYEKQKKFQEMRFCERCKHSFPGLNVKQFRVHVYDECPARDSKYSCEYCNRSFMTSGALKSHKRSKHLKQLENSNSNDDTSLQSLHLSSPSTEYYSFPNSQESYTTSVVNSLFNSIDANESEQNYQINENIPLLNNPMGLFPPPPPLDLPMFESDISDERYNGTLPFIDEKLPNIFV